MSKIEWTDETYNPITGCSKISEGCQNCYAEKMAKRLRGRYGYPSIDPFGIKFHLDRLWKPLSWKKPRRIFICSMGDIFHEDVCTGWIKQVLDVVATCRQHTFIILTKRPHRMLPGFGEDHPNLWVGVSVENQRHLYRVAQLLSRCRAPVRFVSFEPLLGRVKSHEIITANLDWAIIGCESGQQRRHCYVDWIIDLKNAFKIYNKPVFIKQADINGRLVKMPQIDGRVWAEYPISFESQGIS